MKASCLCRGGITFIFVVEDTSGIVVTVGTKTDSTVYDAPQLSHALLVLWAAQLDRTKAKKLL